MVMTLQTAETALKLLSVEPVQTLESVVNVTVGPEHIVNESGAPKRTFSGHFVF